jgi:hypothetical protein
MRPVAPPAKPPFDSAGIPRLARGSPTGTLTSRKELQERLGRMGREMPKEAAVQASCLFKQGYMEPGGQSFLVNANNCEAISYLCFV